MPITSSDDLPSHFKGKGPLEHVIEAQAQGIISAAEVHGLETPGHLSAACDASRETVIVLSLIWILLFSLSLSFWSSLIFLLIFSGSWLLWKTGRSAWLGWFRLERLHRILEQERWEIEHHRQQERDELRVLYAAKGFEGKLLEDVLDVLMADNDRLLKVMVEEELGLALAAYEHPLKQGLGAAVGVLISCACCLFLYSLWPSWGMLLGMLIIISLSSAYSAQLAKNKIIPAITWNLGLATLAFGWMYFMIQLLFKIRILF
jgi:hypothetical protein